MKSHIISLVLIFELIAAETFSQDAPVLKSPLKFSISTSLNYGSVWVHSEKTENTAHSFPIGFLTSFNWQRTDRQDFDLYHCLPRHTLQIGYYDFDNVVLGKGAIISYSLQPHFMVSERTSIYPKFTVGLAFLSNPYDSIRNPANESYSLPVDVHLALGLGVRTQISKRWALSFNAEQQHISNGGLNNPNIGLNWLSASIGIEYSPFFGLELKRYTRLERSKEKFRAKRFDYSDFWRDEARRRQRQKPIPLDWGAKPYAKLASKADSCLDRCSRILSGPRSAPVYRRVWKPVRRFGGS